MSNHIVIIAARLSLFYCCSMDFEKVKCIRFASNEHGKMPYLLKSVHIGTLQLFIYSEQNMRIHIRTRLTYCERRIMRNAINFDAIAITELPKT